MPLPQDFWQQLPLKTDVELYDMLDHQEDWLPEALAAAREELRKRNLSPDKITQIESAAQSQKAAMSTKANERLGWPMRIFLFIFFAGIFGAVLAVYYDHKGYKRKASDCWITMCFSLVFYLTVGVFLVLAT